MKYIEFNISYKTDDTSTIQVTYSIETYSGTMNGTLPLRETQSGVWFGSIEVDDNVDSILYGYQYVRAGKAVRVEWNYKPHSLRLNSVNHRYRNFDLWLDAPAGRNAHTTVCRTYGTEHAATSQHENICWYNRSVTLSLYILGLEEGEEPALAGDAETLGAWRPQDALPLSQVAPGLWSITFDAERIWSGCFHFKFITRRSNGTVRWEEGDNRKIFLPDYEPSSAYSFELPEVRFTSQQVRLAGTVIPLFSMRSSRSWGIGDFGDIKLMVDWLVATGQRVLQLLPVNDTTVNGGAEDSYPYNCVSVFALNPVYTDMESLPRLGSDKRNQYYRKQREALNALPTVDYAAVYMLKINYLHELFSEIGDNMLATKECKNFLAEQERWLKPYVLFRFLSSRLRSNIWDWKEFRYYDDDTEERVLATFSDAAGELRFHSFVQYILYSQLSEAHNYSVSHGVTLKGDIPIGVAPNGVDVWCDREQFNLSVSAGAPPDMFSADGQNWGFPTYNWDAMAADGYAWWRRRLQYMSKFFDAYRIDHILGFFRIWQIPRNAVSGLAGKFSPGMPLSRSELSCMGFTIDPKRHTRPVIPAARVKELFGRRAKAVAERYFDLQPCGMYTFKEDYDTLQALTLSFADKKMRLAGEATEALLRLFGEVLFFDEGDGEHFTPRIDAFNTPLYTTLTQNERNAYDKVYEHYFYQRHNMFWYEEGMRKLMPLLQCTDMTACGEDLGMIPDCVPWVMHNLQILSLEIQRMPKRYGEMFAKPQDYPYLSVATPSTHDMSTLRGWWREDEQRTQQFYNHELGFDGKAPVEMSGIAAQAVVRRHLAAPSMLALFAWQDLLAMDERLRRANPDDERINIPSNRNHVWNYRMHITLEQMMKERGFNEALRSMIVECGRGN